MIENHARGVLFEPFLRSRVKPFRFIFSALHLPRRRMPGERTDLLQDDLSISDPFSQYMTKKSAWRASNFWVLNCRRAHELGGSPAGAAGWGGGCWMDQGGLGGQVCDFVAGLLRKVRYHDIVQLQSFRCQLGFVPFPPPPCLCGNRPWYYFPCRSSHSLAPLKYCWSLSVCLSLVLRADQRLLVFDSVAR